jgi:hypothetical protein
MIFQVLKPAICPLGSARVAVLWSGGVLAGWGPTLAWVHTGAFRCTILTLVGHCSDLLLTPCWHHTYTTLNAILPLTVWIPPLTWVHTGALRYTAVHHTNTILTPFRYSSYEVLTQYFTPSLYSLRDSLCWPASTLEKSGNLQCPNAKC